MDTVIISGVGGFLGSHLCDRLLSKGVKVYGIDVCETAHRRFNNSNYVPIVASFEDYKSLHEKITDEVDVFFHYAWAGGLLQDSFWNYELQLQNARFACDAFMEASKIGCKKFINSGTNNQIEIKQFLASKDFSPRGTCIYSAAKTALDLMCKTLATRTNTEYIGTMIPMPYGIGNKSMQLANVVMISLLKGESPKLIEGNNLYDMVYIEDIVDAFIAIAEKGVSGRTYYIGHRVLKTFKEWMLEIRDIINPNVELKFGEYKDPLNLDYSYVDLDMLFNDTGFECSKDFREQIIETCDWIKDNLI